MEKSAKMGVVIDDVIKYANRHIKQNKPYPVFLRILQSTCLKSKIAFNIQCLRETIATQTSSPTPFLYYMEIKYV